MKTNQIKSLAIVTTFCLIRSLSVQSQTPQCSNQSSSSPTGVACPSQIINDFVPTSSDRTITINLKIHVAKSTNTNVPGAWDSYSDNDFLSLVQSLNSSLASNPTVVPTNTTASYHVPNTKLSFVIKDNQIDRISDDTFYYNTFDGILGNGTITPIQTQYIDANAINVYFGGYSYAKIFEHTGYVFFLAAVTPSSAVTHTDLLTDATFFTTQLRHELSHALGLPNHADEYNFLSYNSNCCDYIIATDHLLEQPTTTLASGNNIVSNGNYYGQTPGGYAYYSPQQLGLIHYNLRTFKREILSSSGYTAATTVDHNFDYNVTSNETWSNDRYIKGDIIVNANKTLSITCGIAMTKGSRIVVLPGGQLVLDGGKITNISGELWDGIYLYGTPFLPQIISNPNNAGAVLYQALLRMKNNATISNAYIGVRNYMSNPKYDAGGIIFSLNSNFINNKTDVDFKSPTSSLNSASWFTNCKFVTDGQIGYGTQPVTHVNIYRTNGVTFRGCEFEWISGGNGNRGVGITSSDAIYFVDKNGSSPAIFKNLREGVRCNNINPLGAPDIRNSKFEDNLNFAGYFINTNYLSFQSNTVQVVSSAGNPNGIYLNNCKFYNLKNNLFTQSSSQTGIGLNVYRSQSGTHQVYRNTFSDLFMGINCMDNNGNSTDGLLMNCNVFNSSPNLYDIVMSHTTGLALPTVKRLQGETNINLAQAGNVVRNIYGAVCGNQNMWQIYSLATQTIEHGSNTNSTTAITQPTATGCKSPLLSVVNMSISLNYTAHCPGNPTSSGGGGTTQSQKLAVMNDYIDVLQSDNPDGINNFEIQATVASKINLFLTDTLNTDGLDSVIAIFRSNQGNLADARLQLAFAYLAKNDLENAEIKIDSLDWDGQYSDWKTLMQKLLALQSDTIEGIFSLNSDADDREFFQEYADTYGMEGQALAQAILKVACDSNYTEPHALPEGESGARLFNTQTPIENVSSVVTPVISIIPNPTNNGVTLTYRSESKSTTRIEIRDLVGKLIYSNFISNQNEDVYIPLDDLASGMYLITLSGNKNVIYKNKIIKQE